MEKPFSLGINILGNTAEYSVPDQIRMLKNTGWDAFFTNWDHDQLSLWAETAAKEGMVWQSIHSPFHRVNKLWEEGEEGRAVAQTLIDCVTDCARCGVPVMVIHPFIGFFDHTPTQIGLDNYARVVEAAEKLGVTLGFENVEGEEYLAALMKTFGDEPCCGFCFDTGHELCYNGGRDMLAKYGAKLCHTHFNDNLGYMEVPLADTWHNDLHLMIGDGIVDWRGVMDRIEKTPYRGILMCELKRSEKPGRHDQEKYAAMTLEEFYAFALDRARKVRDRKL